MNPAFAGFIFCFKLRATIKLRLPRSLVQLVILLTTPCSSLRGTPFLNLFREGIHTNRLRHCCTSKQSPAIIGGFTKTISLLYTFCLDAKSGAKKSRQTQLLRMFCRANTQGQKSLQMVLIFMILVYRVFAKYFRR